EARVQADEHVVERREPAEDFRVLKCSRDTEPRHRVRGASQEVVPVEEHLARQRTIKPGHDIENGGLAGAVGPDEREDLPRPDGEIDVAQRGEAAEMDRQPRYVEQRGGRRHGSDLIQSESGLKCPFSTRTQNPCFWVSWSGPIVMGGRMPVSKPLR